MWMNPASARPSQRNLIRSEALLASAPLWGGPLAMRVEVRPPATVRDRFWLWGHAAGSHNGEYGLPGASPITPVEAAWYMASPNIIQVRYKGKPEAPFDQFAIPFRSLREVVWSVVGAGGATDADEREMVLRMAAQNPNFTGVDMDDFFTGKKEGNFAALTTLELEQLQKRLKGGSKKLDLWVTLYTHQLDDPIVDHLRYCDVVTLWTWKAADLAQMETDFERAEKKAPASRKVLGCYMWDYGTHQPMPVAAMEHQCKEACSGSRRAALRG
jgi:hypothetical protein